MSISGIGISQGYASSDMDPNYGSLPGSSKDNSLGDSTNYNSVPDSATFSIVGSDADARVVSLNSSAISNGSNSTSSSRSSSPVASSRSSSGSSSPAASSRSSSKAASSNPIFSTSNSPVSFHSLSDEDNISNNGDEKKLPANQAEWRMINSGYSDRKFECRTELENRIQKLEEVVASLKGYFVKKSSGTLDLSAMMLKADSDFNDVQAKFDDLYLLNKENEVRKKLSPFLKFFCPKNDVSGRLVQTSFALRRAQETTNFLCEMENGTKESINDKRKVFLDRMSNYILPFLNKTAEDLKVKSKSNFLLQRIWGPQINVGLAVYNELRWWKALDKSEREIKMGTISVKDNCNQNKTRNGDYQPLDQSAEVNVYLKTALNVALLTGVVGSGLYLLGKSRKGN